jgi:acetate kinase
MFRNDENPRIEPLTNTGRRSWQPITSYNRPGASAMNILVLNSGSSSQKMSLYSLAEPLPATAPEPVWEGHLDWHDGRALIEVRAASGATHSEEARAATASDATPRLLDLLVTGDARGVSGKSEIACVGHRIVNGGAEYTQPAVVDAKLKAAIQAMAVFAPLHNRAGLEGIALIDQNFPGVRQIAVFDTGFHSHLPPAAAVYPGPFEWARQGIRRYGFHGINHQYCAERTAQLVGKDLRSLNLVTCHLGNGCSLAAIRNGRSIDTTMGFTPLEGLMMGTRSGSIDPAIVTFLMRERDMTADEIDLLLNKKSGLLGISGVSADMRQIIATMKQGNERAKLAFDIFVHRLQSGIGSMIASLGGIDALVFTAGIGEHSPDVRDAACANFTFLGVVLDAAKNSQAGGDSDISTGDSRVRVLVVRAQEDWSIARECRKLLR